MKRLAVLSIDSLMTEDLDFLTDQPNFGRILSQAAVVRNVREIYPTLTYPIHTTMITGVRPGKHGITHNQRHAIQHERPDWSILGSDWYWYESAIRTETLVDAARREGRVVSSILWPVTAGGPADHNLAEIWPIGSDRDIHALLNSTCSASIMEECFDRHIGTLDWSDDKPDLDSFGMPCALDMIRRHKPHLHLQHIVALDHDRHVLGARAAGISGTLRRVDDMVGSVLDAYREAGIYDETDFVILGDHGQIDIRTVFNPNVIFRVHGLIRTDDRGQVENYDAYCFSAGFSSQVFLKDPTDPIMVRRVARLLDEIRQAWPHQVERVLNADDARNEEGLAGDFSFVLEGTSGTMFHNHFEGPLMRHASDPDWPHYRAMHGHSPDKGGKPPFIAFGPGVENRLTLDSGCMLDVCPTLARMLDVQMSGMEGIPFPILRAV